MTAGNLPVTQKVKGRNKKMGGAAVDTNKRRQLPGPFGLHKTRWAYFLRVNVLRYRDRFLYGYWYPSTWGRGCTDPVGSFSVGKRCWLAARRI